MFRHSEKPLWRRDSVAAIAAAAYDIGTLNLSCPAAAEDWGAFCFFLSPGQGQPFAVSISKY